MSSGGICAWTVAWERPDAFRKVLSHCGSFTDIRGGGIYPSLIRKSEKKPIRIFLQSGEQDLDRPAGNWPLANKLMASALAFQGYDYQFVFGTEGHTLRHGGAIFPDPPVIVQPGDPMNEHRLQLAVPEMMADLTALSPEHRRAEARPLRLLCRRMMHVYNTNFIGALPANARPYNPAFLSPDDMVAYDIGEGETIEIASDFGEIAAIAHTDESLRPGTVSISFGFGQLPGESADPQETGSNTTRLLSMSAIYDRYSGQPRMSNVPVSIRRLAGKRKARPEAGVEDRPGA